LAAYAKNTEIIHFYGDGLRPPLEIELILFMEEDSINGLHKLQIENHKKRLNDMEMKLGRVKFNLRIKSRILNSTLLTQRDEFSVSIV